MATSSRTSKKTTKQTKEDFKKAVAAYNRKVAKDNEAFDAMKPAEKRVFIARDVLAQLKSNKIVAEKGAWVSVKNDDRCVISQKALKEDQELKEVFDSIKTCNVCALGGLFVCAVKINDRLKISELDHVRRNTTFTEDEEKDNETAVSCSCDDCKEERDADKKLSNNDMRSIHLNDIEAYLGKFFSKNQLKLIELAFESGTGGYTSESDLEQDAESFFGEFDIVDEKGKVLVEGVDSGINVSDSDRMRLIMENIIANKGRFDPTKRPRFVAVASTPGFTA